MCQTLLSLLECDISEQTLPQKVVATAKQVRWVWHLAPASPLQSLSRGWHKIAPKSLDAKVVAEHLF